MFKNRYLLCICFIIYVLLLSGCQDNSSDIYNNLKSNLDTFKQQTQEFIDENKDDYKAGFNQFLDDWDIMSPSEVSQGLQNLVHGDLGNNGLDASINISPDAGGSDTKTSFDIAFEQTSGTGTLVKVKLIRVVDGDTLVVELEGAAGTEQSYVRLIGCNTPESVAPDEYLADSGKENTAEGKAASEYVKNILIDTEYVYLEFDLGEYDKYNRILAYVWINNDTSDLNNMLNARLLADGKAEIMTIKPNVKYQEEFTALVDDLR